MKGKLVGIAIMISALTAGAALYYLQEYAFYEDVEAASVNLMSLTSQVPESIALDTFEAIDAESSPIRYRACFTTPLSLPTLTEGYVGLDAVTPRNGPSWFDCFDAEAIAAELDAGTALPFMGEKNIAYGVDRIVVVTEDGRGYVWHELNDCGEKAYDGTVVGEECPPRE